jgi:Tfp pilus assembly protein PilZ
LARVEIKELSVEFACEEAFHAEYVENISQGGIFVETALHFAVRDPVQVAIQLAYCDALVSLRGEVVSRIPVELVKSGATPGVAVQFALSADDLYAELEPHIQTLVLADEPEAGRRGSPRAEARVRAHVDDGEGGGFAANTRDISKSGVLISSEEGAPAVGQSVKLALVHPLSGEEMRVEGNVVRHVMADSGEVQALGIQFNVSEFEEADLGRFVDQIKATEHSRRLGAVSGSICDLDVAALLEMFGSNAPKGTLILSKGTDAGFVILWDGMFIDAQVACYRGLHALAEMIGWESGCFEFQVFVDKEFATEPPLPLARAIRDARGLIETLRESSASPEPAEIPYESTVVVEEETLAPVRDTLSQTEDAIIELARSGATVARVVEVIPETEFDVLLAIIDLYDRGLVRLVD